MRALAACAPLLIALAAPATAGEGVDTAPYAPIVAAPPVSDHAFTVAMAAPSAADQAAPVALYATPIAMRAGIPAPTPLPAGPVHTAPDGSWAQVGIASWYGGARWQGRPTASGERFDEARLTAAHASLPIGSQIRVTVADTGRSVVVTINDRPGTRTRIIDVSRAAARALGIVGRGLARVSVTPN